jgi:hypothetical protein
VGNHDTGDTENSDDRAQLADNLYLEQRFTPVQGEGRASCDPGLYYCFEFGRAVQLVCIDTSYADAESETHFFDDPEHARWLDETFTAGAEGARRWRIPFCHHPPWCAGPKHFAMPGQLERLVPRYQRAGVPLVLCGHEHNFQFGRREGIAYVVAGAGGKLRLDEPTAFTDAGTEAYAAACHCLLVELALDGGGGASTASITAYGACERGAPAEPIELRSPAGDVVAQPLVVEAR